MIHLLRALARPFAGIPFVLREPAYRPYFLCLAVMGFPAGLVLPLAPLWLRQNLGATPQQVGWFAAAGGAAAVVGHLLIPAFADRIRRRKLVTLITYVFSASGLVVAALATTFWMAVVAFILLWIGAAVVSLLMAMAGDAVRAHTPPGERARTSEVLGAVNAALDVGIILGPIASGWIFSRAGHLWPAFVIALGPGAVMTWLLTRLPDPDAAAAPVATLSERAVQPDAEMRPTRSPIAWVFSSGPILPLFYLAIAVYFLGLARDNFVSLYVSEDLHASKEAVGLLASINAAVLMLAIPAMGAVADRFGIRATMVASTALVTVHPLLLTLTTAYWQVLALAIYLPLMWAPMVSAPSAFVQSLAGRRSATATGIFYAVSALGTALGGLLLGRVAETAGYRAALGVSAVANGAGTALLALLFGLTFLLSRRFSAARTTPAPEPIA